MTTNINRKEKTSSDNLESFWNYFKKFDINSVLERNKKGTFVLIKSLNLFLFYYDLLLPLFSNLSASQRSFIIVHNINRLSHSCMLLRFDHMKCIIPLCGIKMKIAWPLFALRFVIVFDNSSTNVPFDKCLPKGISPRRHYHYTFKTT